ncbi:ABC transporter ATP-binding protein [Streptomyces sp. C11-1]|uniref:ABC transporter ATP-binding protein n=1 Tax=Streptomyces durocortorensis TaxID=2811104 RepID=A0ABY9W9I8_9ACTN|nr:ABC transporter ATP-binding protein [Streptomyces durocortorensis]WNF30707.1 ABC transporter ATP-binding protein [Streptomyces durocortorensis]
MSSSPPASRAVPFVRARVGRWLVLLRLLPRVGGGLLSAAVVLNVLIGLLPLAFIVWMSVLLDRLPDAQAVSGGTAGVLAALFLALGAFVLQQLLAPLQAVLGEVATRKVDGQCVTGLMDTALRRSPVSMLEREETLDLLSDARGAFDRLLPTPGDAVGGAIALIARYTQLLGAVVLVGVTLSPWAGILTGATALVLRFGQRGSLGRFSELYQDMAGQRRRIAYMLRTAGGTDAAKEIRVLGLADWFRTRHHQDMRDYLDPLWAGRRRILMGPFVVLALVGLAGGTGVLLLLAGPAARGELSLLTMAVALQAVLIPMRFGVYFPECDVQTLYGMQSYDSLTAFTRRAAEEAAIPRAASGPPVASGPPAAAGATAPAGGPPARGIRFEDVVFRYTPDGPAVLDHLDLEIEAGRSTAVVGLNGAGKTTLVKLLTRLHEPSSGRITADGTDVRNLSDSEWQRRLAVIFQKFNQYELSLRDNVVLGAPGGGTPDPRAFDAAVARAGLDDILARLPEGPDTVLSRQYEGGVDLSGGQWQRVALARAFYAAERGSHLLVLDEPTAQLDVRAEVEFFDRFLTMTKGLTSVVISHRFSTVRRADRIVVLEHGKVAEQGTHEELTALGGRYAELFRLQAQRFAGPVPEEAR